MKINIYAICRDSNISTLESQYIKFCKSLCVELTVYNIFDKHVRAAQRLDSKSAKNSYSLAFQRHFDNKSVLLDSNGKMQDSNGFSNMLGDYLNMGGMSFFIAGAFGFEDSVLKKYPSISLSKLTFSHHIAKIVLLEQIYRGLSIINNHPYHKE